jgi:hypothetical protein
MGFSLASEQATENVKKSVVDAFREIKEGRAKKTTHVHGAAMFGTYSATLLRSGTASPFNVVDESGIPLLTLEEWRSCVAQTAWRPDDRVLERMWELTRGYPSLLQTIGRDLSMSCSPRVTTWAAFQAYERSAAFVNGVLAHKSLQANRWILKSLAMAPERTSLVMIFLSAEAPVDTSTDSSLQLKAERLTSLGYLRALDAPFTFEVASPLIRRLLMERCLQEDYKNIIPFAPPTLEDGRLDILGMIQVAAPAVVKAAISSKMRNALRLPREVVYHLLLELLLSAWLEGEAEVTCEDPVPGAPRRRFDITIIDRADGSHNQSIILELSAHVKDTGENSITSHLEKCRNIYSKPSGLLHQLHDPEREGVLRPRQGRPDAPHPRQARQGGQGAWAPRQGPGRGGAEERGRRGPTGGGQGGSEPAEPSWIGAAKEKLNFMSESLPTCAR